MITLPNIHFPRTPPHKKVGIRRRHSIDITNNYETQYDDAYTKYNNYLSTDTQVFDEIYIKKRNLGKGFFGSVFLVENDCAKEFALKRIVCRGDRGLLRKARNEALLLSKFSSENFIIQISDFFEENGNFHIVMEHCSGGTLQNAIISKKTFSSITICYQIAQAVCLLHNRKIVHRDLKTDNIFFSNENLLNIKLGDFNLSRIMDAPYYSQIGYKKYMAPESLSTGSFHSASDIWSLALVFVSILGEQDFEQLRQNEQKLLGSVDENEVSNFIEKSLHLKTREKRLIKKMLRIDKSKRISIRKVKKILKSWLVPPVDQWNRREAETE